MQLQIMCLTCKMKLPVCVQLPVCVCDHAMKFTVVPIKAKAQAKVGRVSQGGLL